MPLPLFILFVLMMLGSALVVVLHRNPVASAMALVCCFISLAALFIGLNAYFLGIIQILVYAGAVMVLFLFIIMLLDIDREEEEAIFFKKKNSFIVGCLIAVALIAQIAGVCMSYKPGKERAPKLTLREAAYMRGVEVPVPSAN